MIKKISGMIAWIVVFQLIGYGLGQLTEAGITTWYNTLHKSSLTPPGAVFGIVWAILYAMIAVSGWILWENRNHPRARLAFAFFSAQMILNWVWSPLFFTFHQIGLSFFCIVLISLLTLITIFLTKEQFKWSSFLLIPYLIWLLFASYLNGVIWMLN